MGETIVLFIIVIGAILLLMVQGLVLASLNKESENSEHQPAPGGKKSIMGAISEIMKRSHNKGHQYKVS